MGGPERGPQTPLTLGAPRLRRGVPSKYSVMLEPGPSLQDLEAVDELAAAAFLERHADAHAGGQLVEELRIGRPQQRPVLEVYEAPARVDLTDDALASRHLPWGSVRATPDAADSA